MSQTTLPPVKFSFAKRALDIAGAGAGLLILSPVFLLAALWIKVRSPHGSVIYTQERIGLNGTPFKLYKFRTMHTHITHHTGFVTVRDDPRFFAGARVLRKFKIDELPQLLNILAGTMSLVGPRPTVQSDYDLMTPLERERWRALPGLTGLAQINGGARLKWRQRIEYDLAYIRRYRFLLDLKIILHTIPQVLTGKSEQPPDGDSEWE